MFEDQETRVGEEATPQTTVLSSSLDEAVMLPPPSMAADFWQLRDLIKCVADSRQRPLEEVKESQHKLLAILHLVSPCRDTLPINEPLLEPAKIIWQNPVIVTPMCQRVDKKYSVPTKDSELPPST